MSRSDSAAARSAFYAQETDDVFILLLEFQTSDTAQPIRLALSNEDHSSTCGGFYGSAQLFVGAFFQIELPSETGENINSVRIAIDNVDQKIVEEDRSADDVPKVRMWIVRSETLDVVEAGPFRFQLDNASYDSFYVRGELVYEEVVNRRWPQHDFTPNTTPGLF